ncbi:uncharacterized protein LOC6526110 [Drosophila yakuba]|uniref:Uncharacterized protein n=1 Tax=Drosophila yakuba TaxID=7245 RepID=B4PYJ4_DROYA|nr:uncharacterized protein LOC6526110 [Drosophila yakuba]EDX03035.1 uncharacterized protein Dyak_GE15337 [Drosophila yakuba]
MLSTFKMRSALQTQRIMRSLCHDSQRIKAQFLVQNEESPSNVEEAEQDKEEQPAAEPRPRAPLYNPLSRRHTVNSSRLQYINDKYKELANEVELRKPKAKPFVSRHALHSGRFDK